MMIWGLLRIPANFVYLLESVRLISKRILQYNLNNQYLCLTLISLKNISSFSQTSLSKMTLYFELYQFTFTLQNASVWSK